MILCKNANHDDDERWCNAKNSNCDDDERWCNAKTGSSAPELATSVIGVFVAQVSSQKSPP